jgi:hypothetical protein
MDVLRRPIFIDGMGFRRQETVIMDKDESKQLARDSLKDANAHPRHYPSWRDDPAYFWNKKGKKPK